MTGKFKFFIFDYTWMPSLRWHDKRLALSLFLGDSVIKRVVKNPDLRRLEIIAASEKLFETEGYANTSVERIINEVGIAKGTFYYYFKSKEDILHAVVEKIASEMEAHFQSIVEMKELTAIQKLELMFRGAAKESIQDSPVMEIIHKAENRELQAELNVIGVKVIFPLIASVFEQGHREGTFSRSITKESMQLIFAGSQFVLDSGLFLWSSEERLALLRSMQTILELVVGAKAGTLAFISKE